MKSPMQYTETDISDMKGIHSNVGNQPNYAQKSFDDFSYYSQTGDYDNIKQDHYLNKPASTSIANLMSTAPVGSTDYDSEIFFPSRTRKQKSGSPGFKRTSRTQLSLNQTFSNHNINPHFKLKHNCADSKFLKPNLSSPTLSNVRHGKIPVTPTQNSPLSLKQIYNKQIAQSFNELPRNDLSPGWNDSPLPSLKSSLSVRSNCPSFFGRLSQYDNVTSNDKLVLNHSTNNTSNHKDVNKDQSSSHVKILSRKMFQLEGFTKEDVAKQINKPSEYSQQLGKEYLLCFDFKSLDIVQSLRNFLSKITLHGETQERERILNLFSSRYFDCNPQTFKSIDSCHSITCSIILLNTDLYGPNIGKKMNQNSFIYNLRDLNDGGDFDPTLLRTIFQSIAKKPLPVEIPSSSRRRNQRQSTMGNAIQDTADPNMGMVFKRGYVMRKACLDSDGRKIPFGKRGWKMLYATLCEMILFLHKDPNAFQKETSVAFDNVNPDSLRIHHSLASKPDDYQKKQYVFELRLANWSVYLFQASDEVECQQWMEAINLAAACFSAPALPGGVGSQVTFTRPLLPTAPTKLSLLEQIQEHEKNVKKFNEELNEDSIGLRGDASAREVQNFEDQKKYFKFEQLRYSSYVEVLKKNYDKLKSKERFQVAGSSQRMKMTTESDPRLMALGSSLYPIRSSPAIIFETKV